MSSTKSAICIRLDPEVLEHLDELCKVSGCSRSQFFAACVNTEYDNLQGNPKLKNLLQQMKLLQAQFDELKAN